MIHIVHGGVCLYGMADNSVHAARHESTWCYFIREDTGEQHGMGGNIKWDEGISRLQFPESTYHLAEECDNKAAYFVLSH
jgi:hypothetical protein